MGSLYLVATPIGNLEDMTFRAVRVLREVSLIAAEDTRVAKVLLRHFEIETPVIPFHARSSQRQVERVMTALETSDVAVVSDAGMPGISDPGAVLVRQAIEGGFPVIPVPGPSSVIAAAAASGAVDHGFVFGAFLPRRSGERVRKLRRLGGLGLPVILFEAPGRVQALLRDIEAALPGSQVVAGREITKLHEQWLRGSPASLLDQLTERGEFTLVVVPPDPDERASDGEQHLDAVLDTMLSQDLSLRDAVREASVATGLSHSVVYQHALRRRAEHESS